MIGGATAGTTPLGGPRRAVGEYYGARCKSAVTAATTLVATNLAGPFPVGQGRARSPHEPGDDRGGRWG